MAPSRLSICTMRAWKILSLAFVAIGCAHAAPTSSPARPRAGPATAVAAAIVEPSASSSAHPVDRVVLPRLKKLGLETTAPEPNELCRRLAIDLLGRGPTDDERALCTTGKLEDTVDAWLARPEADKVERRFWFDLAQLEVGQAWYAHVLDIDALTGKLVKGEIGYGEFAYRFVMHPALYARHPGADWIRAFYTIFLGRSARVPIRDAPGALRAPPRGRLDTCVLHDLPRPLRAPRRGRGAPAARRRLGRARVHRRRPARAL
jgi:hypothetical protein